VERSEYQGYYMGALAQSEFKDSSFADLKTLSTDNPDAAVRMNEIVKAKALADNLNVDEVTGILAAGPPVQAVVDQNIPAFSITQMLTDATRDYYQGWLDKAVEAQAQAQGFLSNAYTVLQATEKAVFSITPLPLSGTKSFMQSVAAPLAVTAIASRVPGADLLISSATHLGSSLTSTAATTIAGGALAHFGNSFMNALPTGMGIHTVAGAVGSTLEHLTMGAVNVSSQAVGQVGTAIVLGNAAIKSTQTLFSQVAQKGIVQSIFDARQKSAAVIERAQSFIKSIQDKFTPKGQAMIPENSDINAAEGLGSPDPLNNAQPEKSVNGMASEQQAEAAKTTPIVAQEEPAPKPLFADEPEEAEKAKPTISIAQSEADKQYENAALSMLNMQFASRGIDIKNAQIDLDGQTVFKLKNNDLETSKLDQQASDMLQKAMSDPANLKGEVKISVGGQLLVHVKDGRVLAGHAFIKESVKIEANTPSKAKYDELSQPIKAQGLEKTKQVAQAAFTSGMEAAAVTEMLSQHDAGYKELQTLSPKTNEQIVVQAQSRAKQAQAAVEAPQTKQEVSKDREPAIA
jgi:phage-related protein